MLRTRSRLQRLALWLAFGGTVLRGLIPVGFMPALGAGADTRDNAVLMLCSGGVSKPSLPLKADEASAPAGSHAVQECPFAASATPALPTTWTALQSSQLPAANTTQSIVIAHHPSATRTRPPVRGPPTA